MGSSIHLTSFSSVVLWMKEESAFWDEHNEASRARFVMDFNSEWKALEFVVIEAWTADSMTNSLVSAFTAMINHSFLADKIWREDKSLCHRFHSLFRLLRGFQNIRLDDKKKEIGTACRHRKATTRPRWTCLICSFVFMRELAKLVKIQISHRNELERKSRFVCDLMCGRQKQKKR